MLISEKIISKTSLSKWLLSLSILLSIVSFSGYAAQSQNGRSDIKQTELLVTIATKTAKPAISYKKALSTFFKFPVPVSFHPKSVLSFNRLTKIKFDCLSKQDLMVFCSGRSFQHKMIPQSGKEEDLISYQG